VDVETVVLRLVEVVDVDCETVEEDEVDWLIVVDELVLRLVEVVDVDCETVVEELVD